jgi:hypothetical protein
VGKKSLRLENVLNYDNDIEILKMIAEEIAARARHTAAVESRRDTEFRHCALETVVRAVDSCSAANVT